MLRSTALMARLMASPQSSSVRIPVVRREARTVAAAIDFLIIGLFSALCAAIALIAMLLQVDPLERDPTAGEWAVGYAIGLCWFLASSLYAGLGARTVGARLLGLRELRSGPRTFVIRGFLWWPSLLLLGVGAWWPWVDPLGRSIPDMLSGSLLYEPETA
ncbi:MAG: RDD family protein [Chloroflexi bacterium]|nr:RDD family protein [Chloroflexota bacterium]MYF82056.1 RDD family protein [Chloroflexota bacterium]MYI05099.1 RDD family protein [Chloroflexota bacterium]